MPVNRGFSKHAGLDWQKKSGNSTGGEKMNDLSSCIWVPHPRTGVYFPKGHERVMDDLPDHGASLSETCWYRDVDGVDKTEPDTASDYGRFRTSA